MSTSEGLVCVFPCNPRVRIEPRWGSYVAVGVDLKPNRESRRADSNRLPLLQLRVIYQALHPQLHPCADPWPRVQMEAPAEHLGRRSRGDPPTRAGRRPWRFSRRTALGRAVSVDGQSTRTG